MTRTATTRSKSKLAQASDDRTKDGIGGDRPTEPTRNMRGKEKDNPTAGGLTPQEEEDLYADALEADESPRGTIRADNRESERDKTPTKENRPSSRVSLISIEIGAATRASARMWRADADSARRITDSEEVTRRILDSEEPSRSLFEPRGTTRRISDSEEPSRSLFEPRGTRRIFDSEEVDEIAGRDGSSGLEPAEEEPSSRGTSREVEAAPNPYSGVMRQFLYQAQEMRDEIESLSRRQLDNIRQIVEFIDASEGDPNVEQKPVIRRGPDRDSRLRSAGLDPDTGMPITPPQHRLNQGQFPQDRIPMRRESRHSDHGGSSHHDHSDRDDHVNNNRGTGAGGPPGGPPGRQPPDDDPSDGRSSDGDNGNDDDDDEPLPRQPRENRRTRSPTPYGGRNPPSSFYIMPGRTTRNTRFATVDAQDADRRSETEWIRRIIKEKLSDPVPENPALKSIKVSPPESFDGKDDGESFDTWLAQVCRWFRLTRVAGPEMERVRVDLLGQVLSGEAQRWYNDVIDNPDRVERTWGFTNAVVALYIRFIHKSTILTAAEKFDAVRYHRSGGAAQVLNDLLRYASRMVQPPDEYSLRRKLWGVLPDEIVSILGKSRGLSAEYTNKEEIVRQATQIEDAIRTDSINRRMKHGTSGPPSTGSTSASSSHSTSQQHNSGNRVNRMGPSASRRPAPREQRPRPIIPDRKVERPPPTHSHPKPATAPNPGTFKGTDRSKSGIQCYACGAYGHISSEPICPQYQARSKPAVRRMAEAEEPEATSGQNIPHPTEEADNEREEPLEGSQYDPDEEYPEEDYEEYPGEVEGAWMGGIRVIEESDHEEGPTEWLGKISTTELEEGVDGETDEESTEILESTCDSDANCHNVIDRLSRGLAEYSKECADLYTHVIELSRQNTELTAKNKMWTAECFELSVEIRALRGALLSGATQEEVSALVDNLDKRSRAREHHRESILSTVWTEDGEEEPASPTPFCPPEDGPTTKSALEDALWWESRANEEREAVPRMAAMLSTRDREYRSAIVPKEVRPHRDFKCMTAYVEVNGLRGLALLDSGSSIDCISPDFARVAKVKAFALEKPVGLQLGCVGSRSSINFGVRTDVSIGKHSQKLYMDVVNIDHYDVILGVPSLQQYGTQLDFAKEVIVINGDEIPSLQVGEEVRTAKPTKRAFTGTSAKYQWAAPENQ